MPIKERECRLSAHRSSLLRPSRPCPLARDSPALRDHRRCHRVPAALRLLQQRYEQCSAYRHDPSHVLCRHVRATDYPRRKGDHFVGAHGSLNRAAFAVLSMVSFSRIRTCGNLAKHIKQLREYYKITGPLRPLRWDGLSEAQGRPLRRRTPAR